LRRKWESDRYRAWVAQGEKLSAAEPFIQPFAMSGFGWVVAAAYGGASTGMLGVQTYQACVQGQGSCADAMVQVGVGVATHYATKGLSERGLNEPVAPRQPTRAAAEPVAPERVANEPATPTTTAPIPKPTPKDFEIEGPTHPELFPESEKTFEM